jgi:hypothetical protein
MTIFRRGDKAHVISRSGSSAHRSGAFAIGIALPGEDDNRAIAFVTHRPVTRIRPPSCLGERRRITRVSSIIKA